MVVGGAGGYQALAFPLCQAQLLWPALPANLYLFGGFQL